MVAPLLAGIIGTGFGFGVSSFFKKEPTQIQYEKQITYAPTTTYAPQITKTITETISPQYTYAPTITIESPYATVTGARVTKKEEITPRVTPQVLVMPSISPEQKQLATATSDMMGNILFLALIGVGGYILYKMLI